MNSTAAIRYSQVAFIARSFPGKELVERKFPSQTCYSQAGKRAAQSRMLPCFVVVEVDLGHRLQSLPWSSSLRRCRLLRFFCFRSKQLQRSAPTAFPLPHFAHPFPPPPPPRTLPILMIY